MCLGVPEGSIRRDSERMGKMSTDTAGRIARLVANIDAQPASALKEQSREIVAAVLELHREGLDRIVALLQERGPEGRRVLEDLIADPLVASLLALHDLAEPAHERDVVAAKRPIRRVEDEPL
jgi:hypothetical protein